MWFLLLPGRSLPVCLFFEVMQSVGVLGHSYLYPYLPGGSHQDQPHNNIVLNYFCSPGATFASILNTDAFSDLLASSPDLVIVVLGGNDFVYGSNIGSSYNDLLHLFNIIYNSCSPNFGVYLLEPEKRYGNPHFVDADSYRKLRNGFVRKLKQKNQVNFLPLIKFGVGLDLLCDDGVHLNDYGCSLFDTVLKFHISDILFDGDLAPAEL